MEKCPICENGKLEVGKVKEEMYGVDLGEYPAEICSACGESFLDAEAMKQIEQKAKEKGIWGINKTLRPEFIAELKAGEAEKSIGVKDFKVLRKSIKAGEVKD